MSGSILITGATSGIGKQLALDYANSGWRVIACGRNESVLSELSDVSSQIETLRFDVTNYEETMRALSSLSIVPDTWVFNAGDCEYMDNAYVDARLMARVLNVNVVGVLIASKPVRAILDRGTE